MTQLSEKQIHSKFKKVRDQLISTLGRRALYDSEIDQVGSELFSKWYGVHPQDKMVFVPGYQVINVDKFGKDGSHWIGIYITKSTIYVYDSYGRSTDSLLKYLTKKAKSNGYKVIDSDNDQEQKNSDICGHLSLAWLQVVSEYGIRNALKI